MPMNFSIRNILQLYFKTSTLEETPLEDMERLAGEYPYLAPLQFLLSKKYRQLQHPGLVKQAAKTTVYFNNPYWFNVLLDEQFQEGAGPAVTFQVPAEEDKTNDTAREINRETPQETIETTHTGTSVFEDVIESLKENLQQAASRETPAEDTEAGDIPEAVLPETIEEIVTTTSIDIAPEESVPEEEIITDAPVEITENSEDLPTGTGEIIAATEMEEKTHIETLVDDTGEDPVPENDNSTVENKLSDIWKQPLEDTGGDRIPLEPLYTVDYFASQGIKLSQSENTGQDKLSVKLKSFTEWLKTMKRIHPEKLPASEEQVQTVIQHIAENSNKHNEILTEAMAEVFARQGLKHKAIEVYEKLSLQNPDKRSYFAAKILNLNET